MPTTTPDTHYRDAINWLDTESYAYFVTDILNMGKPVWDATIPTACVSVPRDTTNFADFSFRFNPEFAQKLPASQLAFVAAHETLHIVLNHLSLGKKYPDHNLFNIAADCVINDYLAQQGFDVPEWVMRGEDKVGYDCANVTVAEVYGALQQLPPQEQAQPGEGEDGNGGMVDSHDWIHDADSDQQQAAEKAAQASDQKGNVPEDVKDTKTDVPGASSQGYGADGGGEGRSYFKDGSVTLKWEALIRKVNPDAFKRHAPRPTWYRQPRRLTNTNVRLPERNATNPHNAGRCEQPAIVIALDTSGSIQDEDARRFVNLAKSVPQSKVKLFPMTFTTDARELDLDNPRYESGGTEFGCIENYIQQNVVPQLGHYPKAVVVITDGMARFSTAYVADKHRKNWTWLATREDTFNRYAAIENGPSFGTVEALDEFTN
jgi:predicted metal-dependent peptidase